MKNLKKRKTPIRRYGRLLLFILSLLARTSFSAAQSNASDGNVRDKFEGFSQELWHCAEGPTTQTDSGIMWDSDNRAVTLASPDMNYANVQIGSRDKIRFGANAPRRGTSLEFTLENYEILHRGEGEQRLGMPVAASFMLMLAQHAEPTRHGMANDPDASFGFMFHLAEEPGAIAIEGFARRPGEMLGTTIMSRVTSVSFPLHVRLVLNEHSYVLSLNREAVGGGATLIDPELFAGEAGVRLILESIGPGRGRVRVRNFALSEPGAASMVGLPGLAPSARGLELNFDQTLPDGRIDGTKLLRCGSGPQGEIRQEGGRLVLRAPASGAFAEAGVCTAEIPFDPAQGVKITFELLGVTGSRQAGSETVLGISLLSRIGSLTYDLQAISGYHAALVALEGGPTFKIVEFAKGDESRSWGTVLTDLSLPPTPTLRFPCPVELLFDSKRVTLFLNKELVSSRAHGLQLGDAICLMLTARNDASHFGAMIKIDNLAALAVSPVRD